MPFHSASVSAAEREKERSPLRLGSQRSRTAASAAPEAASQLELPPQRDILGSHRRGAAPAAPEAAPAPAPAAPQAAAPEGGSLHDKELLTKSRLLQRPAFQGKAADMPEVRGLIGQVESYEQTVGSTVIPAAGGNFMREMGRANAQALSAHAQMTDALVQASIDMRQSAVQAAQKRQSQIFFRPSAESVARLSNLADDTANLAAILQSQKIYMNKIYDDMITAFQTNSASLAQFSGKSYAEVIRTMGMYRFDSGRSTASALGAGGINTVYRDQYEGQSRVFKRGKTYEINRGNEGENTGFYVMVDRLGSKPEELNYGSDASTRIGEAIKDANTAQRDVAYSRLNLLFGFDIAVNTQLARSEEGESSSLMDMAQGETAADFLFYSSIDPDLAPDDWSRAAGEWAARKHGSELAQIEESLAIVANSIQQNKAARESGKRSESNYRDNLRIQENRRKELEAKRAKLERRGPAKVLNLADPKIALQLFKMSVLDLVAGHVARHEGNYMISQDAEGGPRLTAIDNDTSFGTNTNIGASGSLAEGEVRPILEDAFPFVPQEILDRTLAVTEDDLRHALTELLSEAQIKAACERLKSVQELFRKLQDEGKVQDVSDGNVRELLGRRAEGSYHGRLFAQSANQDDAFKASHARRAPAQAPGTGPLPAPPAAQRAQGG